MRTLSSILYEADDSTVPKSTKRAANRIGDKEIQTPASVKNQIKDDSKKNWSDDEAVMNGESMPKEKAEKEFENGHGSIDIEAPNGETIKVTKDSSKNLKRLLMKFMDNEPFFVQGEAGWAKTQLIKKVAKSRGFYVITVYLDKVEATDLGGIPVAQEHEYSNGKKGVDMTYAMPQWGITIRDNPDKKFLLFFDEFNQAKGDVMNALMPIVLENTICGKKFDNFLVGAAGNFDYENIEGVNDVRANDALLSRFLPLIIWESDTDATWKETFDHLHDKWDKKIGSEFIDAIEKSKYIFKNPREIEHKIIQAFFNEMKEPEEEREALVDSEWVYDKIARVALHRETKNSDWEDDDMSKHLEKSGRQSAFETTRAEDQAASLADFIADRILKATYDPDTDSVSYNDKGKDVADEYSTDGDSDELIGDEKFINDVVAPVLKDGRLKDKYLVNGKPTWLGVSLENWPSIITYCGADGKGEPRGLTAEEIEYVNNMIEEKGVKVKFKTNEDFLKIKNYANPEDFEEEPELA